MIQITLKRSSIGASKTQRATLQALGLRKTGDTRTVKDTPDVQGMIRKVEFLLDVQEASK